MEETKETEKTDEELTEQKSTDTKPEQKVEGKHKKVNYHGN